MESKLEKVAKNYERSAQLESRFEDTEGMNLIREETNLFKEDVVKELLREIKGPISILNLAAGRGGDLHLLSRTGVKITKMTAVDISPESLKVLTNRHQNLMARLTRSPQGIYPLKTIVGDVTKKETFSRIKGQYDVIIINLAIHYTFLNPNTVFMFWKEVGKKIKAGGHLLVTFYDKRSIACLPKILHEPDGKTKLGSINVQGNSYFITLGRSLIDVEEPFVDEMLLKAAMKHGGFTIKRRDEYEKDENTPWNDSYRYLSCLRSLIVLKLIAIG